MSETPAGGLAGDADAAGDETADRRDGHDPDAGPVGAPGADRDAGPDQRASLTGVSRTVQDSGPAEGARPDQDASPDDGSRAAGQAGGGGAGEGGGPVDRDDAAESSRRQARTPVEAGKALSGDAAQLLAAVRAVESGERPAAAFYTEPERPAARRPAPSAVPRARTEPSGAPGPSGPDVAPDAAAVDAVREVLAAGGAPGALAAGAARVLGPGAAEALHADPWQLLAVAGVRPEQADGFARALLGDTCGPGDERRLRALVRWLLEQAALKGHTVLESATLRQALERYGAPEPDEAVRTAVTDGDVLVFQETAAEDASAERTAAGGAAAERAATEGAATEGEERPVRVLIGLDRFALAEESLADGLGRLVSTFAPAADAGAWESAAAAAPSPSAAELIRAAAGHGLVLHTGGEAARAEPAALVAAARAAGLRAYAVTHTPDGRRRVAELLGGDADEAPAVTLAGLLDGGEGPGFDAEGNLAVDVLAVLDAPQLDVEAAAALVEALPDGARLVLSGDPAVLCSAGPGQVFADVAAARTCPRVASRTPDPGPVGELVSGIGVGELQQVEAPGKEVVIVPVQDAAEAVHRTVQLVVDSVPRALGVPSEQTQVITAGHGGPAGTRALNTALKERLNPGPGAFGGFDPGDRVAYVPGPGRVVAATVSSADDAGLHLAAEDGTKLDVRPESVAAGAVRHAWALTAHQAAGRRWPAAVAVVPGDAGRTLTRAWAYTAFSRAERHLSVVHGAGAALPRAIADAPAPPRTTRLRDLLRPHPHPAPPNP